MLQTYCLFLLNRFTFFSTNIMTNPLSVKTYLTCFWSHFIHQVCSMCPTCDSNICTPSTSHFGPLRCTLQVSISVLLLLCHEPAALQCHASLHRDRSVLSCHPECASPAWGNIWFASQHGNISGNAVPHVDPLRNITCSPEVSMSQTRKEKSHFFYSLFPVISAFNLIIIYIFHHIHA